MRDPLPDWNAHVRELSRAHRIRRDTREDGEVVLLLGSRKSGSFAGVYGENPWRWLVHVHGRIRHRHLAATLDLPDALVDPMPDDEPPLTILGPLPEEGLIALLDRSPKTKPRRRMALSPEEMERRRAHMAAVRKAQIGLGVKREGP